MPGNSFTDTLNRPYYLETLPGRRWMTCFKYGAFVFLFLVVFQPFGLSALSEGILTVALGYGLTTFLVMAILNIVFFSMATVFFSEEKWNVLKEIYWNMINVLLIGAANAAYSSFIGMVSFTPYVLLVFELYTVSLAVLPITITVLVKESRQKNKFEEKSEELNTHIESYKPAAITPGVDQRLVISSENEKDKLEISINDLVFIQSSDNYVEVYFQARNTVNKKLLRNTLKRVAARLEAHKDLFRCHKSYLVNVKRISHVSGNAQGYKLQLSGTDILIPVSRQNNDELKRRLDR